MIIELNLPAWLGDAVCAQTDPEVFFPEKGASSREAIRVCKGCTVAPECLRHSLKFEERFGVWGGVSERDRRKMRRIA